VALHITTTTTAAAAADPNSNHQQQICRYQNQYRVDDDNDELRMDVYNIHNSSNSQQQQQHYQNQLYYDPELLQSQQELQQQQQESHYHHQQQQQQQYQYIGGNHRMQEEKMRQLQQSTQQYHHYNNNSQYRNDATFHSPYILSSPVTSPPPSSVVTTVIPETQSTTTKTTASVPIWKRKLLYDASIYRMEDYHTIFRTPHHVSDAQYVKYVLQQQQQQPVSVIYDPHLDDIDSSIPNATNSTSMLNKSCCAYTCSIFSGIAVIFLLFIGFLLDTQPLYIPGTLPAIVVQSTTSLQQQQQQQRELGSTINKATAETAVTNNIEGPTTTTAKETT
jgi:hypothetical protein